MKRHASWLAGAGAMATAAILSFQSAAFSASSEQTATQTPTEPCAFSCAWIGRINPSRDGHQTAPDLVRLQDGRFLVSWHHSHEGNVRVKARIFDPARNRWTFAFDLNDEPLGIHGGAFLTPLSDGGALAYWWTMSQDRDEDGAAIGVPMWELRARGFDLPLGGMNAGSEQVLWSGSSTGLARARIIELRSERAEGLRDQRLLNIGGAMELRIINRRGDLLAAYPLADRQLDPRGLNAFAASDGGAHVLWVERGNQLRLAHVDAEGQLRVASRRLAGIVTERSGDIAATELASGHLALSWSEGSQRIRFAVISREGEVIVRPGTASRHEEHNRYDPFILAMPDGGFTLSWTDEIRKESWSLTRPHIHINRFNAQGDAIGLEQNLAYESGNRNSVLVLDDSGDLMIAHYSGTGWTQNVYLARCRVTQ
jgi:hypothetical protein